MFEVQIPTIDNTLYFVYCVHTHLPMSMHRQHNRQSIPNPASQGIMDDSLLNQFLALSTQDQVIDDSCFLMHSNHLTNLFTDAVDF